MILHHVPNVQIIFEVQKFPSKLPPFNREVSRWLVGWLTSHDLISPRDPGLCGIVCDDEAIAHRAGHQLLVPESSGSPSGESWYFLAMKK